MGASRVCRELSRQQTFHKGAVQFTLGLCAKGNIGIISARHNTVKHRIAHMFAADVMLGRTARWLRLLGCDTFYRPSIGNDELLFKSLLEGRILLTRDTNLARRAGAAAYLVRSNDLWGQLREICAQFGLAHVLTLERCSVCNGELTEVEKDSIAGTVPAYTFLTHDKFFQCANCGKVFWEGSHVRLAEHDIQEKLGENENT